MVVLMQVYQSGFWSEINVLRSKTFVPKLKKNVPVILVEHLFLIREQLFAMQEQWCRYTKTTLVYRSGTQKYDGRERKKIVDSTSATPRPPPSFILEMICIFLWVPLRYTKMVLVYLHHYSCIANKCSLIENKCSIKTTGTFFFNLGTKFFDLGIFFSNQKPLQYIYTKTTLEIGRAHV